MTHPDDIARLREIKRLLERIQRLPRIAAMPANGATHGPMNGLDTAHYAGVASGYRNGHGGRRSNRHGDDEGADGYVGGPLATADVALAPEPEHASQVTDVGMRISAVLP